MTAETARKLQATSQNGGTEENVMGEEEDDDESNSAKKEGPPLMQEKRGQLGERLPFAVINNEQISVEDQRESNFTANPPN